MKEYLERDLKRWDNPLSTTENRRSLNAHSVISNHLKNSTIFKNSNIEIFIQGSYANATNVRENSDIDICVMLRDTFRSKYPQGKTRVDYGYSASNYTFEQFKKDIATILVDALDINEVKVGNKSIKVSSNSYRNFADVVPCFEYRIHNEKKHIYSGVTFDADDGKSYYNYPKQHIEEGKKKNRQTNHWYKKMVRNIKSIMYDYQEKEKHLKVSSFVLEGILFNVENSYYKPRQMEWYEINEHKGPNTDVFVKVVNRASELLEDATLLNEPNNIQKLFEKHEERIPNHYKMFFEAIRKDYLQ